MARKKGKGRARSSTASHRTRPAPAWWERLPDATQHSLCIAFLVGVAAAFFGPILFTGQSLIGGDTVQWRAMAEAMFDYRAATGEEPLWAPNGFGGMPGYMISYPDVIPQADTVATALRSLIWPASHFLFLLFGMYLLVFFISRDKLASVLAAAAYGLTTYIPIILAAGHNTKFIALCFAPWLLLAFVYALRKPGLLAGVLFAVALAVNIRADHVQITYYTSFLIGIWWIGEGIAAYRQDRLKAFGQTTAWLAGGSVLALLMVAQPLLTHFEYKDFTIRGAAPAGDDTAGLAWDYAMNWSQGWGELVTLFVADAYGGGGQTYWGPKPFTEGPHYVGGVVLLLAGLALYLVRSTAARALGIGVLLMTLFSLGEHFEPLNRLMFTYFPLFDAFRVPETWLSIVALALAVLAGLGLAQVRAAKPSAQEATSTNRAVYGGVAIALGLAALLFLGGNALFDFERPGERDQIMQQIAQSNNVPVNDPRVAQAADNFLEDTREERQRALRGDAGRTLLFLLIAGAALVLYRRERMPGYVMAVVLVLLVVTDLWGVDRRHLNSERLVPAEAPADLIATHDFDRFLNEQQREAGGPGQFRVLSLERAPMNNARPAYHYETIGGYHGAKLRLYQDYIDFLYRDPGTAIQTPAVLDLMNVRYVVSPQPLPGMQAVFESEDTGLTVLERPDAAPRAYFVGETAPVETPEDAFRILRASGHDVEETAVVQAADDLTTTPITAESIAEATVTQHTPREITVDVATDAPRLLVLSEVYYPAGWRASIGGEAVPIHRVNHFQRGLPIPEGAHTLTLRFAPSSHTTGVWIAGVSTTLVYGAVLFLLIQGVRQRRLEEAEGADAKEG